MGDTMKCHSCGKSTRINWGNADKLICKACSDINARKLLSESEQTGTVLDAQSVDNDLKVYLIIWYLFCGAPPAIVIGILDYLTRIGSITAGGPAAVSGDEIISALYFAGASLWMIIFIIINLMFLKWPPSFIKNSNYAMGGVAISAAPFLYVILSIILQPFFKLLSPAG